MQITAFKDPITGMLFEKEAALTKFVSNRNREEATAKRQQAVRDAADRIRKTMVRKLASKDQFCELARTMYEHVLTSTKTKRNKAPLQVRDIRISDWRLSESLRLSMHIEVELSGCPDSTYADVFVRMSPTDVLYPFGLSGSGTSSQKRGSFTYQYGICTELGELPKLLAAMRETARLQVELTQHEKNIAAEASTVQAEDMALKDLRKSSDTAQKAVQVAQDAYAQAIGSQRQREQQLAAEVAERMPFDNQAKLAELEKATGLNSGTDDRWLRLGVRNALIRYQPETA